MDAAPFFAPALYFVSSGIVGQDACKCVRLDSGTAHSRNFLHLSFMVHRSFSRRFACIHADLVPLVF